MSDIIGICDKYEQIDNRIKVIHKENEGVSIARNIGIDLAKGKYIWFVDSDDRIVPNIIGELLDKADNSKLDVLGFCFKIEEESGELRAYNIRAEEEGVILNGKDFICKVDMPHGPWAAILRRQYLIEKGLNFIEGIIHEDIDYTMRTYCLADRIMFISKVAYYYFQRGGGTMKSSQSPRRASDFLTVSDSLYNFAKVNLVPDTPSYARLIDEVNFAFSQSFGYTQHFLNTVYKGVFLLSYTY